MTAYEYLDLAHSGAANASTSLAFGFSLLCAYLFVAYLVGSKLTTSQVIALTVIYMVSYLLNTAAHLSATAEVLELTELALELSPNLNVASFTVAFGGAVYIASFVRLSIFVISLWFMWDVRHPKKE